MFLNLSNLIYKTNQGRIYLLTALQSPPCTRTQEIKIIVEIEFTETKNLHIFSAI
jgi:hypothetical protein